MEQSIASEQMCIDVDKASRYTSVLRGTTSDGSVGGSGVDLDLEREGQTWDSWDRYR